MNAKEKAEEIVSLVVDACCLGDTDLLLTARKRSERALLEARITGMREASNKAAGPDEGYLHGCECRSRIRQAADEIEKDLK